MLGEVGRSADGRPTSCSGREDVEDVCQFLRLDAAVGEVLGEAGQAGVLSFRDLVERDVGEGTVAVEQRVQCQQGTGSGEAGRGNRATGVDPDGGEKGGGVRGRGGG